MHTAQAGTRRRVRLRLESEAISGRLCSGTGSRGSRGFSYARNSLGRWSAERTPSWSRAEPGAWPRLVAPPCVSPPPRAGPGRGDGLGMSPAHHLQPPQAEFPASPMASRNPTPPQFRGYSVTSETPRSPNAGTSGPTAVAEEAAAVDPPASTGPVIPHRNEVERTVNGLKGFRAVEPDTTVRMAVPSRRWPDPRYD